MPHTQPTPNSRMPDIGAGSNRVTVGKMLLRAFVTVVPLSVAISTVATGQEQCADGAQSHGCICADSTNPFAKVRELEERLVCLEQLRLLPSVSGTQVMSETPPKPSNGTSPESRVEAATKKTRATLSETKDLVSFIKGNFGIGLFGGHGTGSRRIESARVEDGRVVIDQDTTNRGAVVLEFHRYPWHYRDGGVGLGGFAMVSSIPDDLTKIDSFGTGVMVGLRDVLQGSAFLNIGIGLSFDRDIKELAPGFVAGELAPLDTAGNPKEPGLVTKSGYSWFFLISITPKLGDN